MTENKRFTVNEFKRICDYENEINQEVVCIKLNVFYEMKEELKKENEQLKQAYTQLKHKHSLLHDECIDAECDRDSYRKDIVSLEKENEELNKFIDELYKKYEDAHGMSIENTDWF